ncbi:MAG: hypothetical protein ACHQRM_15285 [Bacteroidia bacterium]
MRTELEHIEHTERFLEGKLNQEEKTAFEKSMAENPSLKEETELQAALTERVQENALKQIIAEVHEDRGRKGSGWKFMLGLLILSSAFVLAYQVSRKNTDMPKTVSQKNTNTQSAPAIVNTPIKQETTDPMQSIGVRKPGPEIATLSSYKRNPTLPIPSRNNEAGKSSPQVGDTSQRKNPAPPPELQSPDNINTDFTVHFNTHTFNSQKDVVLSDQRSGATIFIPGNILVTSKGKPVTGNVKLFYREFRDAADMALSGIPMTYHKGDSAYNFNSAGMFELWVLKGSDTLRIRKGSSIRINFAMTQEVPGLDFYKLQKEDSNWTEIGKILPAKEDTASKHRKHGIWPFNHFHIAVMGGSGKRLGHGSKGKDSTAFERETLDTTTSPQPVFFYSKVDRRKESVLAKGADAGHTYMQMVQGLLCKDFGVYNCDQVYRMGKTMALQPSFTDSLGKPVSRMQVVNVIDLDYNGSFSFDPKGIIHARQQGRNVILLFTTDKRLYAFSEAKFKQAGIIHNGACKMEMTDLSKTVKNTAQLKAYLGLKE